MNILTALANNKINEKLKAVEDINILNKDIQYKEGILEYLEKNKNIDIIIFLEELPGQIKTKKLIEIINSINNKIKIIIITNKNKEIKNNKINKKIRYFYLEKINYENIIKMIKIKNNKNILRLIGNRGVGKTILCIIISEIIINIKKQKVLLIDKDNNFILTKMYSRNSNNNENLIKIKNNLYILKDEKELYRIKEQFDYIIIDSNEINVNTNNNQFIIKDIFILEANLLELKKINNLKLNNIKGIILNKNNKNNISEKIIEKIFNKKIIGKINYNKKINLFINNNFNLFYFSKNEIDNIIRIIENI